MNRIRSGLRAASLKWRSIMVAALMLAAACASSTPKLKPEATGTGPKKSDREILLAAGEVSPLPSEVFCGNKAKHPPGSPCVMGSQPTGKAKEHVEIRGTVTGIQGFYDADSNKEDISEEFLLTVLLDHGWKAEDPNQPAIATLSDIDNWTTPYNANTWGQKALLRPDGVVWGGPGAMVIHVEVDGWLPSGRMCRTRAGDGSCNELGPAPSSWGQARGPGQVRWAFDPEFPPSQGGACCRLRLGSYVRLVGTLWEDEVHEFGLGPIVGAAHSCWNEGRTSGRGWMEMHPVDYVALIDEPPPASDSLETLVLCEKPGPSGTTTSFAKDITLPGPPPSSNAHVACEYRIDPDFTDPTSIDMHRVTRLPNGIHVEVQLKRAAANAKFKATYRVSWSTEILSSPDECRSM